MQTEPNTFQCDRIGNVESGRAATDKDKARPELVTERHGNGLQHFLQLAPALSSQPLRQQVGGHTCFALIAKAYGIGKRKIGVQALVLFRGFRDRFEERLDRLPISWPRA